MAVRIAALLTCHNRRDQTLHCLDRLQTQSGEGISLVVILLDAGSTDGTSEAIACSYPEVTLLPGSSDQFWNTGMYAAFQHASQADYDYYWWLNDDTLVDAGCLDILLQTERAVSNQHREPTIVVGSTRDPQTGELTYGGVARRGRTRPLRFDLVEPGDVPIRCDTMNGNCVLVPREVVARIGLLDSAFTHSMGDYDYGLRSTKAGCPVWVAPGTLAECARNPGRGDDGSLRQTLRRLSVPKGLPPAEWTRFARRWAGPLWPLYAASPYIRRLAAALRR